MVKVLTCSRTEPPPDAQQEDADDEQDVIEALRQDVREAEREILPRRFEPGRRRRRGHEGNRRAALGAFHPQRLHGALAHARVQGIRAHHETVGERHVVGAVRHRAGEPNERRRLRDVADPRRRDIFKCRPIDAPVELHDQPIEKHACQLRDPPVALDAGERRRDCAAAVHLELRQQRIRIDGDVELVCAVVAKCRADLRLADLVGF